MFTIVEKSNQKGFTLIEMAISMIIIGLLVAPLLVLYSKSQEAKKDTVTFEYIESAVNKIQEYRKVTGAYPCPGSMTAPRGVAGPPLYGAATDCLTDPLITALVPGDCANGICVEGAIAARAATLAAVPIGSRVLVGALPFRELQIPESKASDGYKIRLLYAVTESMVDPIAFNINNGAIAIRDDNGDALSSPDGNIAFLVLSHGKTKAGGYNQYGGLNTACPAGGATVDEENCNDGFADSTGPATAEYIASFRANALGAGFFDDQVMYFTQVTDPMWKRVDATMGDPEDIEVVPSGDVLVGNPSAMVGAALVPALDISGGINAGTGFVTNPSLVVRGPTVTSDGTGEIRADWFCDENGENCFQPRIIAGDPDAPTTDPTFGGLDCRGNPSGEYLIGIENNQPVCSEVGFKCPDSMPILESVNGSGTPTCIALPDASCLPTQTISDVCPGEDRVFSTTEGDGWRSGNQRFGACRDAEFQCDNGVYEYRSADSALNCTNDIITTGIACPVGQAGTYSAYRCGGDTSATDCTCISYTLVNGPNACPSPEIGTTTTTTTYFPDCSNDGGVTTGSCVCPPAVAQSGATIVPCGVYGSVGDVCQSRPSGSCSAPEVGTPVILQIYNTSSCGWNTVASLGGCTCSSVPISYTAAHSCADPICEIPSVDNTYERSVIDPPCAYEAAPGTLVTPGSCVPRSTTWIDQGANGSPAPSSMPANPTRVGDPCGCSSQLGNTKRCFLGSDPSPHDCVCQ